MTQQITVQFGNWKPEPNAGNLPPFGFHGLANLCGPALRRNEIRGKYFSIAGLAASGVMRL